MRHRVSGYSSVAALSLAGLTAAAGPGMAQSGEAEARELFTPEVAACLEDASAANCAELLPAMTACAEDPAVPACSLLLADPEVTQADPAALEEVKQALTSFGESAVPAAGADEEPSAAPEAPSEAAAPEAQSETVAPDTEEDAPDTEEAEPPAPVGEAAAPLPETSPETQDPASTTPDAAGAAETPVPPVAEPVPSDLPGAAPAAEAGAQGAGEAVVPSETEAAPAPEAEGETAPEAGGETAAENPAGASEPAAPAAEGEAIAPEGQAETPEPGLAGGDAAKADAPEDAAAAEAAAKEAEAAEAAEVERLLKEAESAAAAEPEVIEEEIAEEAPVPAEAPAPALDAESQKLVEDLSRQPEVAAALEVLGASLKAEGEDPAAAPDAAQGSEDAAKEPAAPAEVVEEEITPGEIRRSTEDFTSRLVTKPAAAKDDGRNRDLERAGLVALGALAVGMLVSDNRVVARGDDRVIVQRDDGALQVWRDDDAILRRDGGSRRIERYADGTSVSEWRREDGSQVVTVRDATGRVISRQRVLVDGTTIPLFDDAARVEPVDVSVLPPMRYRELRLGAGTDPDRALALLEQSEAAARSVERSFSLRQIRDIRQVRELVPVLSPDPIIFQTNRASIDPNEIAKLFQVGRVIERLIERNPGEVFLIEGHTDATGSAAYNLGLSDRRAESVALALTEYFRIPPENLIVQGYGESFLRIPTELAEDRNRRVVMRRITPLLAQHLAAK